MVRCGVVCVAGVGRILMILCPFVTDIVYCPPPANFNLGCDRWLTYLWPAIRKAVSARRYVLDIPSGICIHSGIITLRVSPVSSVIMP